MKKLIISFLICSTPIFCMRDTKDLTQKEAFAAVYACNFMKNALGRKRCSSYDKAKAKYILMLKDIYYGIYASDDVDAIVDSFGWIIERMQELTDSGYRMYKEVLTFNFDKFFENYEAYVLSEHATSKKSS